MNLDTKMKAFENCLDFNFQLNQNSILKIRKNSELLNLEFSGLILESSVQYKLRNLSSPRYRFQNVLSKKNRNSWISILEFAFEEESTFEGEFDSRNLDSGFYF